MKRKLWVMPAFFGLFLFSTTSAAEGTIAVGKNIAASCAGCHGEFGNSTVPTFPKLAGQHEKYIVDQLEAFKNGSRNDPMMASFAAAMDDQAMEDVAAFFAFHNISRNEIPDLGDDENEEKLEALVDYGADIYRNGNLETKVSACIACHGPNGNGNKQAGFPALRNQHRDYIEKALNDFKNGTRNNSLDNMMHKIAKKMSKEEIRAISYYLSLMD